MCDPGEMLMAASSLLQHVSNTQDSGERRVLSTIWDWLAAADLSNSVLNNEPDTQVTVCCCSDAATARGGKASAYIQKRNTFMQQVGLS